MMLLALLLGCAVDSIEPVSQKYPDTVRASWRPLEAPRAGLQRWGGTSSVSSCRRASRMTIDWFARV